MLALAVLALLVPVVAYAGLIYLLDLHEREPLWALGLALALGGAAASAALTAERALLAALPDLLPGLSNGATLQVSCFLVIGPVEELTKLLVTLLFARRALMNEPVDGVVYAGFVSLGFAAGEGLLGAGGLSASALLLRAVLPLPAHVFFSALWGAGLGATRHWGRAVLPWLSLSLVAAALLHGAYDYLLFSAGGSYRGAVVGVLAVAGVLCSTLFRALLVRSPFRGVTARAGRCAACERSYGPRSRICAGCGELLVAPADALPVSFQGTLLTFGAQALSLTAAQLVHAALRGTSPGGLWHAALAGSWWEAAPLLSCLLLSGVLSGVLATRVAKATTLDLWLGSAVTWLCTLLYLTLSAPALTAGALVLLPSSLLTACTTRALLLGNPGGRAGRAGAQAFSARKDSSTDRW